MIGLIIKDVLNLKKSLMASLLMLLFFSIAAYQSKDPSFLIGVFVIIISMQAISAIAYDDLAKWDVYALTMPVSRRELVTSKYILAVLLSITALIVSGTISYFFIFPLSDLSIREFLVTSYLIFAIAMLLISVILPLIYKLGVERSRLLLVAVILIPTSIGVFLNKMGIALPDENQLLMLAKISPIIIIGILLISILISTKIYRNKDI